MAIDYTPTPLSVAARTTHFVDQICTHADKQPNEFDTFEKFVKFLDKNRIHDSAGYNKNRIGYMETLRFIWELDQRKEKINNMKKYYVMYWNDREDYPVAVFEVEAENELKADEIAYANGGDQYEDDWPLLTETEDGMTEDQKKRYKESIYTAYYDLTKEKK